MNDLTLSRRAVSPLDLGTLLVCSQRYALGRMSYMPTLIAGLIRKHWHDLETGSCDTLRRDLREAIVDADAGHRSLGMFCDDRVWRGLLRWMELWAERDVTRKLPDARTRFTLAYRRIRQTERSFWADDVRDAATEAGWTPERETSGLLGSPGHGPRPARIAEMDPDQRHLRLHDWTWDLVVARREWRLRGRDTEVLP